MIDWLDEEVWLKLKSEGRWNAAPVFYLIASIVYVGYLPFSATKVSGRRRKEIRENVLLLAVKRAYALTWSKAMTFEVIQNRLAARFFPNFESDVIYSFYS